MVKFTSLVYMRFDKCIVLYLPLQSRYRPISSSQYSLILLLWSQCQSQLLSLAIIHLFSILIILLLLECHINGIMWYVAFEAVVFHVRFEIQPSCWVYQYFVPFLLMNGFPLWGCSICLSIHQLKDIGLFPVIGKLG